MGLLGAPWGVLGAVFWAPLGVLGAPWGLFGRVVPNFGPTPRKYRACQAEQASGQTCEYIEREARFLGGGWVPQDSAGMRKTRQDTPKYPRPLQIALGVPWGLLLGVLGGPWGSWKCLWDVLGRPGGSLGRPWRVFGRPWGPSGCPRGVLGAPLGVLWGPLGGPWGSLGTPWGILGAPWASLGGPWGLFWGPFGVLGAPWGLFR